MEIKKISVFRDGGSLCIHTNEGDYWLPHPIGCGGFKYVYFNARTPENMVTDQAKIIELLGSVAQYGSQVDWLKQKLEK